MLWPGAVEAVGTSVVEAGILAAVTLVAVTLVAGILAAVTSAVVTLVAGILAAVTLAVATLAVATLAAVTSVAGILAVVTLVAVALVVVTLGEAILAVAILAVVTLAAVTLVAVTLPMAAAILVAVALPVVAASLVAEVVSIGMRSAIRSGGIALVEPEALVELGVMTGVVVGAGGADGPDQYFGPIFSATCSRLRSGPITTIRSGRMVSAPTLIIAVTYLTMHTADWATYTVTYMALVHMAMDTETIDAIRTLAIVPSRAIQMRSWPM
jgi:hypothetical protein